jgi:hypothetical protein
MCYIFTQTFTSNSLHNIYHPLLLHTSVTGYGHLQEATNFTNVGAVNNKYFGTSLKWKFACNGRLNREGVTLNLQTNFFFVSMRFRTFILFRKADNGNYTELCAVRQRLSQSKVSTGRFIRSRYAWQILRTSHKAWNRGQIYREANEA